VSEGSIRAGLTDCDSDSIAVVTEPYEAASEAHAVVVLTDWEVFKAFDYERIYSHMKKPAFLFDGRNLLNLKELSNIGYKVCGVGVG
jgi:UDPglucose 6-dehydrogenase